MLLAPVIMQPALLPWVVKWAMVKQVTVCEGHASVTPIRSVCTQGV